MCFLHTFLSKPRESVVLLPIEQERSGHAWRWTRLATVSVCLGAMGDFAVCSTACRTPENAQNPEAFAALAGLPVNKEACGWLYCKRGTDTQEKSSRYRAQAQANFHGKDIGLHGCSTCKPLCVSHAGEIWHCVGHTCEKKGGTFWKLLAGL